MKKILLTLTFCTIFVAWGLLSASELTDEHTVVRGERPPVSLKSLTAADYEAGKIYVKFKAEYSNLVQSGFSLDKNQCIKTGLPELDVLNQQYLASEYKQIIQTVYSSNQKSTQYKQRHQAWGFHLWFEVKLAEDAKVLEAVEAFQSNPAIELAEPLYKKVLYTQKASTENSEDIVPGMPPSNVIVDRYTPDDPLLGAQWHYNNTGTFGGTAGKDISLFDAWDIEKGHNDVIVAIIDGGIQTDHEDLAGNMWSGVGYNFVDDNSTIIPHSHGTHVAGTVAAETNNNTGVAGVAGGSGSNDGVRLMSCQVFKAVEGGDMGGGFAEAMIYAADNGAAISQNSWGTRPAENYNHLVLDAIDYFNAYGGGDVLDGGITIFAAGNSNSDSIYYPAYYSGTLSVAATNNRDERSYYSNYGDYIDISAPGGEMNVNGEAGVASTYTDNGYMYLQGTSMACPHASGVAALIVSYAHRNGVTLKNADVYQILKETTDDHYAENPGYIGKLGTGRLNAHAALLATNNYFSPTALTPDHSFDFDGTMQGWYSVATTGHKNFVWTDQGALYGGQIESATADNGYVMLNNLYEEWMGPSPNAAALYSPIFELTGFTNLFFSFDHKAKQIGQDYDPPFPNMSIKLEASNDGFVSNIQELWSYNFPNTAHLSIEGVQSVNISALAGSPNVQFRFNYAGGGGYWWLIDDVSISSLPTPTFSLAEEFYISDQTVFISNFNDYDSGTNIYYTLDGSAPTSSSVLYDNTNGILLENISESVTIYAIAINGANESGIGSATYYFPVHVANIATLRTMAQDGTTYKLTGEVVLTFQTTYRNAKYIQDATGAILIDDYSGIITTTYDIYDGITGIIGTLSTYQNMLQFIPSADPGSATSTGNTVTPVEVTLANLDNTYQAKLVKIIDVSNSETGNYVSGHNYNISDPSGSGVLRTAYSDLDYIDTPISEDPQNVIGVILQFQSSIQLVPRSLSDLTSLISFYFRGPSWMDNNPHDPQIWGPFNGWSGAAMMTYDNDLEWWKTTIEVADPFSEIEYQARFSQVGQTKYQKAFGNFSANPTFTTTTSEIWIDASEDASFVWSGSDFYLAEDKITEEPPVTTEPANHVTNLAITADSESQISLSWIDSDAAYYLIKGSAVGYADISDPIDGTAEADALLVKNVGSTIQNISFGGLDVATTYYFKIFPYNGVGSTINFKTDGTVPQEFATTNAGPPYYYAGFEGDDETKGSYASGTVTISNVEWNLTEALIGESASDYKTGVRSVRMRGYGTSAMTMLEDKANGIGSIYFNYRRYGTDQQVDWKVEYSVDGGSNWTQIGSTFTAPASDEVQTFHEKVNMDGNVRIRIKRATETGSTNRRLNIDDMLITDYNKVTFLADMSLAEGFDAETDDVYLSGNLIAPEWGEPGTNSNALFSRLGPTNTWINVLNLSELQYEYKLFKNTGWSNGEWDGNPNRKRTVSHGEIITELYSYVEFSGNGAISDPSNWAASTIPDGNNIMISGTAQLNQALVAESVIIEEGGSITIPPLQDLTVNNTLTNNAGAAALLLQSDASGTGSLIHSSADVPATIQRYINGGGYHLVSVPINGALTAGLFMHSYLYYFDATADPQDWDGVGEDPEIAITNNQGYMIWFTGNNTTYDFEGALMSGDFVTATPAAASVYNGSYNEGGYNLVPNPYPSAIDWNAEGGFTENNLFETIWIYNRDAGNYGAYVRDAGSGTNEVSNIIPVGQSFFVQASNAGSGSLTIKNEARTHSANNFLKEPAQIAEMLRLHAAANNLSDELLVQFNADASPTFEGNRDAKKMRSDGEAPQLFSLSEEGTELSINTLPYRDETIVIPIGFELSTESEVSFNFTNLESFSPLAEIYLEDLLSGQMINLREQQEYSFTHATENDPFRFRLHFKGVVGLDEQAVSGHLIWSYDDKIYVCIPALTGKKVTLQLVDLQGKMIYQGAHNLSNPEIITVRTNQHVLVARIIAGNQVFTNKVFIR